MCGVLWCVYEIALVSWLYLTSVLCVACCVVCVCEITLVYWLFDPKCKVWCGMYVVLNGSMCFV